MVISIKTNGIIKAPGNTDHNNTTSIIFYSGFKLQWGGGEGGNCVGKDYYAWFISIRERAKESYERTIKWGGEMRVNFIASYNFSLRDKRILKIIIIFTFASRLLLIRASFCCLSFVARGA